jgi:hypothetical protein
MKSNPAIRKELGLKIEEIVKNEKNKGVKNVYFKVINNTNK